MSEKISVPRVIRETDNAILVATYDEREVWLPFSQIDEIDRYPDGHAEILLADWLVRKEDL